MGFHYENGLALGTVIARLEAMPGERVLRPGIATATSYRRYYECLGLVPCDANTVAEALRVLRAANGSTMKGYRGGSNYMDLTTECYVADWGDTGPALTEEWFQLHWGAGADLRDRVAELEAEVTRLRDMIT